MSVIGAWLERNPCAAWRQWPRRGDPRLVVAAILATYVMLGIFVLGFNRGPAQLAITVGAAVLLRAVEPLEGIDEMRRRLAGGVDELAIEAPLAQSGLARQHRHVEPGLEIALHPFHQAGERRVGVGLRAEQRAELRLEAGPSGIQDEMAGDEVGGRCAEIDPIFKIRPPP